MSVAQVYLLLSLYICSLVRYAGDVSFMSFHGDNDKDI